MSGNGNVTGVAVHANCLLKETVWELVPYPLADHVQEMCNFPEEGSPHCEVHDLS